MLDLLARQMVQLLLLLIELRIPLHAERVEVNRRSIVVEYDGAALVHLRQPELLLVHLLHG